MCEQGRNSFVEKECLLDAIEKRMKDNTTFSSEELAFLTCLSSDSDSYIRYRTADVLSYFSNDVEENLLRSLTKDNDPTVRVQACDSLASSKSLNTYELLLKMSHKDRSGLARGHAITTMVDISIAIGCTEQTKEHLLTIFKNDKVEFVQICALYAQYVLGDKECLPLLLKKIDTRKYQNRCAVVNSLIEIIDGSNKNTIIECVQERKAIEKSYAVISTIDELIRVIETIGE